MFDYNEYITTYGIKAKKASRILANVNTEQKNKVLLCAAGMLREFENDIIIANKIDIEAAAKKGISEQMIERLTLNHKRIDGMAEGLEKLVQLTDPIGEITEGWTRPNGLEIYKKRVPIGVIGIIYESRPNVTADAAGLCVKSGNACILRGGSEAINSNTAIAKVFSEALEKNGLPMECVQLIDNTSRDIVNALMKLNKYVDVLIPRGGAGLINNVVMNSTVPVIQTGTGICHTYVDKTADLDMAISIILNAKVQRPSVCNSMETLLIDQAIAKQYLPIIAQKLEENSVELRGCEKCATIMPNMIKANETDWDTEYNALILSIRIVNGVSEAISHINEHGTLHSETIVAKDYDTIMKFQNEVDAACVYANASTRFTDGFEFGFGAEIGISNQKLHPRGPMGLKELTTTKYIINGNGQIRS